MEFGERWQFDGYTNRTFVRRGDRLVLHDAISLAPEDGSVAGRMGRFNCLATVVMTGPAVGAAAVRLAGEIGLAPLSQQADLLMSAAPLAGGDAGVLLRVAGMSVEQVGAVLRRFLNFVASLLGDDPWGCKFLYCTGPPRTRQDDPSSGPVFRAEAGPAPACGGPPPNR